MFSYYVYIRMIFLLCFTWFSFGFPMVFIWFSYGFHMVFLWFMQNRVCSLCKRLQDVPRHPGCAGCTSWAGPAQHPQHCTWLFEEAAGSTIGASRQCYTKYVRITYNIVIYIYIYIYICIRICYINNGLHT